MTKTYRIKLIALGVLAGACPPLCASVQHPEQGRRLIGSAVVRHEGAHLRLELWRQTLHGRPRAAGELRWRRVHPGASQSLDLREPLLWRGALLDPGGMPNMACVTTTNNGWSVVGNLGGRIWCWTSDRPPWSSTSRHDLDSFAEGLPLAPMTPHWPVKIITHIALVGASGQRGVENNMHASLFVSSQGFALNGRVYVVGSGMRSKDGGKSLWISRVPGPGNADAGVEMDGWIDGQEIGTGRDPRVADLGEEILVAFRPAWGVNSGHHAPLGFYRSRDLVAWTRDEALSTGITAARDYALGVARGSVWIATTEPGEDGRSVIALFRYDAEEARWQKVADPSAEWGEVASPYRDRLWLFPTSVADPYPLELLYTDDDGQIQIRRP